MSGAAEKAILAELKMLNRKVDALSAEGKPGLTQAEFARRCRISARTVSRRIKAKQIRLQDGLVPHRYLAARLS